MAWIAVVTQAGERLMQQWLDSAYTMVITEARGGTGTVAVERLYQQDDVAGTRHTLILSHFKRTTPVMPYSVLEVSVQVRPEASAYTLKQVGVFAKLMDGDTEVAGNTMLAIYQAEAGDEADVPSTSQMPDYVYEYDAKLNINVGGALAVNIDPNTLVTRAELAEALATVEVRRIRTVEAIAAADWHAPGTTWTQDGQSFTAPAGMYACALEISDVQAVSVVMDSWLEAGEDVVLNEIEYETMDGGWMLLTSAAAPGGSISIGMMILV